MPKRSRHASHFLMIIGGVFAILLVETSIFELKPKLFSAPVSQTSDSKTPDQGGQIEGVSTNKNIPAGASVDTASWKTYRDPVYHFTLKYPKEWTAPVAKKVNDPDFEYEYQVLFGTKETFAGTSFEGFNLYVFQTGKCDTSTSQINSSNGSSGETTPSCSTKKSSVSTGTGKSEKILEFSSIAYTYTIVPYIPPDNADPELIKKINLELEEAGKAFQYDPTLKIIVSPKLSQSASVVIPPKPAASVGRRGKLTGAIASGGKLICPHPNRKPTKSPNQGKHVDEDCCPDPDEYPNAACAYKPSDYKIML
jgi:hypothetical protein